MSKSNPENFSLTRPVVLIGMMGAGKTSVGRALASLLNVPFFDADSEIEAASRCSIAQIFADYGEGEFRRLEQQIIARLLQGGLCVLSVGGGAFINPQTRARIKENALSIWLKVDDALLLRRVLRNDKRPMLQGGDPKEKLEKLLTERAPIYGEADLIVACDDRPVTQTALHVLESMRAAFAV